MWSITMDTAEAKRAIFAGLTNSERRLTDAIRVEAARVVQVHGNRWIRPLFTRKITTEAEAEDVIRAMLFDPDRKRRDAASRRLGMSQAWEWHRRADLADEARVVKYFRRLDELVRMDGVTSVALTGTDAALLIRATSDG